jgi:hypothetical protein
VLRRNASKDSLSPRKIDCPGTLLVLNWYYSKTFDHPVTSRGLRVTSLAARSCVSVGEAGVGLSHLFSAFSLGQAESDDARVHRHGDILFAVYGVCHWR